MREEDIAGALLIQRADLFYFSGTGQNAHLYVPAEGKPVLIVKKSLPRAREESALEEIIPFTGWDIVKDAVASSLTPGARIGVESDVLPANLFFRYAKLLADYNLVDISPHIRLIRAVKSQYELEQMQEAAAISEAVFNHARTVIREGMTEVELSSHLEMQARIHGHQGYVRMRGFNQELYYGHIMAGESAAAISFFDGPTGGSGLNPSYPQGAGISLIKAHEPILIDFVGLFGGYMVDQTRIFCLGKPARHLLEAHKQALNIKNMLIELGKPGVNGSILYARAEEMADRAGLANHFMGYVEKVSFVGHGVGIELDELPVIARNFDQPLQKNMVFALEPKFIFPGEGVVGVEDTFMVGEEKLKQITSFDDQLQEI